MPGFACRTPVKLYCMIFWTLILNPVMHIMKKDFYFAVLLIHLGMNYSSESCFLSLLWFTGVVSCCPNRPLFKTAGGSTVCYQVIKDCGGKINAWLDKFKHLTSSKR